jgi:hypothetical protein
VIVLGLILVIALAILLVRAAWIVADVRGRPPAKPTIGAPAIVGRGTAARVVLVHGIPADAVALGPLRVDYFRRSRRVLDGRDRRDHRAGARARRRAARRSPG